MDRETLLHTLSMQMNVYFINCSGRTRNNEGVFSICEKTSAHSLFKTLHAGVIFPTPTNINSRKLLINNWIVISLCWSIFESKCFQVCKVNIIKALNECILYNVLTILIFIRNCIISIILYSKFMSHIFSILGYLLSGIDTVGLSFSGCSPETYKECKIWVVILNDNNDNILFFI